MDWTVVVVFVIALMFFEGIAFLIWMKGRRQKPGFPVLSVDQVRPGGRPREQDPSLGP